ncbi:hypothetical protein CLV46_2422 [Diaminobutyricimonas aerilata]|uniref:Uncharacterized protein n=1 Tax=Diaminobutyricimonas aerilata TaxID=1162967 RepID=A0A2M9CLR3_9MICO|nr:hypothetical protein [Diaminobutyricimonas aerilata]PJJ72845.1 hypothetical protein CLV46_2422 [Diaminobutyricimonas aerilata]
MTHDEVDLLVPLEDAPRPPLAGQLTVALLVLFAGVIVLTVLYAWLLQEKWWPILALTFAGIAGQLGTDFEHGVR